MSNDFIWDGEKMEYLPTSVPVRKTQEQVQIEALFRRVEALEAQVKQLQDATPPAEPAPPPPAR